MVADAGAEVIVFLLIPFFIHSQTNKPRRAHSGDLREDCQRALSKKVCKSNMCKTHVR